MSAPTWSRLTRLSYLHPFPPSLADGAHVMVGGATLALWSAGTRSRVAKLSGHPNPVRALAFTPSGAACLSCAPGDRFVAAWDVEAAAAEGEGKGKGKKEKEKAARPATALLPLDDSPPLQLAAAEAAGGFAAVALSEQGVAYVWLCDDGCQPVASRVVRVRAPAPSRPKPWPKRGSLCITLLLIIRTAGTRDH